MANNSIAVLNVGSQTISLGIFTTGKKELTLTKYASTSVLADPANEAVRLAQVKVATENLLEQVKVKKSEVIYAVSGSSVFTRFVKLPALGDNDIQELVTFEAQQHIPFPISEVAWDWQLIDNQGAEKEVAIVAIKKNILNEIDESIESTGLISKNVESAQFALANCFYHAYPDYTEPTLIIDSGAKSTSLIYIEGKRIFIRSVNVSGVNTTSAISKEYNVDFAEAEKYKTEAGRIAPNGAYLEQWDEATATLATVISNAVSRLPSEIARTTNYYRSQHSGSAPTRILLAGAGSSLPYYKELLEDKTNLPIEYFNPFRKVKIGGSVDAEQIHPVAHTMGELVGLALKAENKEALEINLIPESVASRTEEARKRPYFIGALAAFLVGSAVWAGVQMLSVIKGKEKIQAVQGELSKIGQYEAPITKSLRQRDRLVKVGEDYVQIVNDRTKAVSVLKEVREHFNSKFVWISSIEYLVDYEIPTEGEPNFDSGVYVNDSFDKASYGSSQVKNLDTIDNPTVNAVKIQGYWRKNEQSAQVVNGILEKIKSSPGSFSLKQPGKGKTKKALDDNQILVIKNTVPEGEIKAPFTMVLPLAEPRTLNN